MSFSFFPDLFFFEAGFFFSERERKKKLTFSSLSFFQLLPFRKQGHHPHVRPRPHHLPPAP